MHSFKTHVLIQSEGILISDAGENLKVVKLAIYTFLWNVNKTVTG